MSTASPANSAEQPVAGAIPANMTSHLRQVESGQRTVCVVDDDPGVLDSLTVLLKAFGFDVLTFGSGAELLADEGRRTASCLVIDQHMPGMDGLAAIGELRNEGVTTPTIFITGRLDANIAAQATKLGVTEILEKPFSTARVVELVRTSLDQVR